MSSIPKPIRSIRTILCSIVIALFLQACETTYEMQVDAIKNPDPTIAQAESYVLVPRDPATDVNDLQYKETVNWVKTALSAKGMYEALDPYSADVVIQVDYGMEPPRQEIQIVEVPEYIQVRGPDRYETRSVRDPNTGSIRTITVRVPGPIRSELVGYREEARAILINEKYMVLTAKENTLDETSGDAAPEELWSITVINEDDSTNLREYLPIMVSAATDYIGEDTQSASKVKIKSDDEVVAFIKKGLQKERPASAQ